MNSILGLVVPLAMFLSLHTCNLFFLQKIFDVINVNTLQAFRGMVFDALNGIARYFGAHYEKRQNTRHCAIAGI